MKKSLIALAVAGLVSAPAFAATSNVDIYGIIDGSVTNSDIRISDGETVVEADGWSVGSHGMDASRLGFKGSEDLGGGLKAIWQIESGIDVEGSGTTIGKRNTFVGLAGGWGTFLIGNHDTPEKLSTASLDFFADTLGDYNTSVAILDTRENNVMAYISPTFSGVHFAIATVAGEGEGGDGVADHWSGAAIYQNGPLHLSAAYTSLSDGYVLSAQKLFGEDLDIGGALPDTNIWRLGVGYTFGDLKVGAVYQNIDIDGADGAMQDGYSIGGAYTMGPIVLKAQYMQREDVLKGFAIGADYNLSKRTKAYVVYTDLSEENSDFGSIDADALTVGLRHSF